MQKSASPKKSVKRVTTTTETVRIQRSAFSDQFFEARENASLQIDLQKAALTIEDLQTTLISLNMKLQGSNDLKADIQMQKNLSSELQTTVDCLQAEIRKQSSAHNAQCEHYQATQKEHNLTMDSLRATIQQERVDHATQHQAHLTEKESMEKAHQVTRDAHLAEVTDLNKQHVDAKMLWDQIKLGMEQRHTASMKAADELLAKRDEEYKNKIADLISMHNQITEDTRKKHESELARRLAEQHAQEQSWLARHQQLVDELSAKEQAHQAEMDKKNRQFSEMKASLEAAMEAMRIKKDQELKELHASMEAQRSSYETRINEMQRFADSQATLLLKRETRITEVEHEMNIRKECESERNVTRAKLVESEEARESLRLELVTATDYINELEGKYLKAQTTCIELLRSLKETEFDLEAAYIEIQTLKQYIIDLKSRIAVYIPVRGDPVDKRLAEYINNFPDRQKLKIMFMRESDGVYQFGTKRVSVKVEKDKINIRVGGGYLSIDEFLDQYTPVELEKLERKDPLKRFNEKIAVQKTIAGKELRESSPVRGSPRKGSPTKTF